MKKKVLERTWWGRNTRKTKSKNIDRKTKKSK